MVPQLATALEGRYRVDRQIGAAEWPPSTWPATSATTAASHARYDVATDGRFLMLKRAGTETQTIIVHNWAREVQEKTAVAR